MLSRLSCCMYQSNLGWPWIGHCERQIGRDLYVEDAASRTNRNVESTVGVAFFPCMQIPRFLLQDNYAKPRPRHRYRKWYANGARETKA
eukprot:6193630-Pleurochrysis_carterae.AAC.4